MIGLGLSITQRAVLQMLGFSPNSLFSAGEQGVWYDPSDFSTMFQDAAGTTPVTAVEQPVGRILDKSGRGNHATQTTTTSRPVLSARVNIINSTEDITSSWNSNRITRSKNLQDPLGGYTACAIYETSETGIHWVEATAGLTVPYANTTIKRVVYLKYAGVRYVMVGSNQNFDDRNICVDLLNGLVVASGSFVTSSSITEFADGWWRVELLINTQSSTGQIPFGITLRQTIGSIGESYTGNPSKGLLIWRPDARVANVGTNLPAYQRVNTATDYDTAGFPMYLRFDGVDDWLVTPSINFTSTDKMTVFAGVRKLSDAVAGVIAEINDGSVGENKVVLLRSSSQSAAAGASSPFSNYEASVHGSLNQNAGDYASYLTTNAFTAPTTSVLSLSVDIALKSIASASLRANALVPARQSGSFTGTSMSGNLPNAPLYIGRRGGTTAPFNGHLYSLIVRGAQSTAQQIASAEAWVNGKTGAY